MSQCKDCDEAAKHAYSDATTPGFFSPTCARHTIDTGDVVLHGPTGERWVVAYVKGKYLAWCGWPEGEALLSDCTLVEKATDEKRKGLLHEIANMPEDDPRRRYARLRLEAEQRAEQRAEQGAK